MKLTPAQENLIMQMVGIFEFAVQWGTIPFIIYLGFRQGPDPHPNGELIPFSLTSLFYG